MFRSPRRPLAALAPVVATLALLVAASAQANSERVTRGDAQAVFEAASTGGAAIRVHSGVIEGAPAASAAADGIRINAFILWEGRHYCSLDWHVVAINLSDGNLAGESRTRQEIAESLSTVEVVFSLDGVPLDTTRAPVRPNLNPPSVLFDALTFTEGRLMAPEDLSVGAHTLGIVISDPGGIIDTSQIIFFVDAEERERVSDSERVLIVLHIRSHGAPTRGSM